MTNLILQIPTEEQTMDLAKEYYQFQVEHDGYDSSTAIEDLREYQWVEEIFNESGDFWLEERVNHTIREVCGRELESICDEHGSEGRTVHEHEGFSKLIKSFENARQTLRANENLHQATNYTIQKCINLIRFAKERGYGVTLAS